MNVGDEQTVLLKAPIIESSDPDLEQRKKTENMNSQEQFELSIEVMMLNELEKQNDR
jgi:hypothetical protein